jgi:lycopene beta-cyclase
LHYDIIFVGGGLAGSLCAYRLRQLRPELGVLVLEQEARLGGNHTWSFFASDLDEAELGWTEPFVAHQWDGYEVRFPGRRRRLTTGYRSSNSDRLHAVVSVALGDGVRCGAAVAAMDAGSVRLRDGETLTARCVVDARGPDRAPRLELGFQKFTGLILDLAAPHGLEVPIIMDATVDQGGDYRFVYVLPLGPSEVLVEDTRYSVTPGRDALSDESAVRGYAQARGWQVQSVRGREEGVLPITLGGDIEGLWQDAAGMPLIGLRAALFHATTGYSFADAVRTADAIATSADLSSEALGGLIRRRSIRHWRGQSYLRFLNRMLFLAARPGQGYRVMERFYGLPQGLIERFYADRLTSLDRLRILTGKPPVAILPALRCLSESSVKRFHSGIEF